MEIKEQDLLVLPNKEELTDIKSQVSMVQNVVSALTVDSSESMSKATDVLHNVRQAEKYITEKKEEITRPQMQALASIRNLFKPLELSLQEANKTVKSKMLAYQIEEDARIEKETARIEARVAKGTMKAETAAGKLENIGEVGKVAKGEVGKSYIRSVKKIRIVDETVIPREYLIPNMALITEDILRKGASIAGVETYEEKQIVSR